MTYSSVGCREFRRRRGVRQRLRASQRRLKVVVRGDGLVELLLGMRLRVVLIPRLVIPLMVLGLLRLLHLLLLLQVLVLLLRLLPRHPLLDHSLRPRLSLLLFRGQLLRRPPSSSVSILLKLLLLLWWWVTCTPADRAAVIRVLLLLGIRILGRGVILLHLRLLLLRSRPVIQLLVLLSLLLLLQATVKVRVIITLRVLLIILWKVALLLLLWRHLLILLPTVPSWRPQLRRGELIIIDA